MRIALTLALVLGLVTAQRPFRRVSTTPDLYINMEMSDASNGYALTFDPNDSSDSIDLSAIQRTNDGGRTFQRIFFQAGSFISLMTNVATTGSASAVTAGPQLLFGQILNGITYTTTGTNFLASQFNDLLALSLTLGAEVISGVRDAYGIAGEFANLLSEELIQGTLITVNGGQSYRLVVINNAPDFFTVVSGSYPTNQVWYLAGANDVSRAGDISAVELLRKRGVHLTTEQSNCTAVRQLDQLLKDTEKKIKPFKKVVPAEMKLGGGVFKTTNGGVTWTRVFDTSNFNPTQIQCPTINNCYLIGTGITIVVTTDGGITWRPSYTTNDPSEEIYDISCATATECYATGGKLSELAGWFLYTNNAGASWTKIQAPSGVYPNAISFRNVQGISTAWATSTSIFGEGSGFWTNAN